MRGISAVTSRVQIRSILNKYKHATSDFRFGKHPNKATTESSLVPAAPPALCCCSLWEQFLEELRIMSLSNVRVAPTRTACQRNLDVGNSTEITILNTPNQRHLSRAFVPILRVVNRCRTIVGEPKAPSDSAHDTHNQSHQEHPAPLSTPVPLAEL